MKPVEYRTGESFARELDAADPLARFRDAFLVPGAPGGGAVRYFAGNSLGLQPKGARELMDREMTDWAEQAVAAHFGARTPWFDYHLVFRDPLSRLVGAEPAEVVLMNSLTVNLHLLMISFYRPTPERYKILVEQPMFPSDRYAVQTQIFHHGFDPASGLVEVAPRPGETTVRDEDVAAVIDREGDAIALVLIGGVNFLTGQRFDMAGISRAARAAGCRVGFDLAHAAGNVPLALHDWDVDFAVWCSYKYLNGGPGAAGGAFVHARHGRNARLPRLAGWWGNDPGKRFRMQLEPDFEPQPGADGWQVSNPSILAMAPLRASLALFDEAGMPALREKSVRLTGYLEFLLRERLAGEAEMLTGTDPEARGCQLSIRLGAGARERQRALAGAGFVCDFREPDVLRVAPTPLHNRYHDVWALVEALRT